MTAVPFTRPDFPCTHEPLVNAVAKSVSIRIRERRHALGLSQSGLAELAGVSPELVSRIERGRCLPSLPTLVTFANVLRTTPNDLLGFEQPLANEELRPLLDAVNALGPAQRAEIRRIAEALAKYQSDAPPKRDTSRPRRDSGFTRSGPGPGKRGGGEIV
jgi:transcriptional regulator with XRE-family HTH domain